MMTADYIRFVFMNNMRFMLALPRYTVYSGGEGMAMAPVTNIDSDVALNGIKFILSRYSKYSLTIREEALSYESYKKGVAQNGTI